MEIHKHIYIYICLYTYNVKIGYRIHTLVFAEGLCRNLIKIGFDIHEYITQCYISHKLL